MNGLLEAASAHCPALQWAVKRGERLQARRNAAFLKHQPFSIFGKGYRAPAAGDG